MILTALLASSGPMSAISLPYIRVLHGAWTQVPMLASGTTDGEPQPSGPPIAARCETDIFKAVGLHYVPPHLRHSMRDDL
jgi:hypothetical protein